MRTLTLPLAAEAEPTRIDVSADDCHTTYDDRGQPTEAKELAGLLAESVPYWLLDQLLTELLRRNLEFDREMGHWKRSEVWYSAYMLSTGDPEAAQSAFAPFEELQGLRSETVA